MGKPPDFIKARDYILARLENELSPHLIYHSPFHTLYEVVPAVERLATLEKVGEDDRLLLLTAAYYHDSGFIYQRQKHESISIQLAGQSLPGFGYSDAQIIVIQNIIQATCIPQSPANLLEQIMADSDLDYLGGEDFWERSNDLRGELENYGQQFSDNDWYVYQIQFMRSHQYFTASERSLRDAPKNRFLQEIERRLNKAIQGSST